MEFPQEIESDSDTEVILGLPKHQTKIDTPERNWEENTPVTEGDTHPPGTHPPRDHSPSTNQPGTHSPHLAEKFPHPYHRAHTPHTPDTHLPRSHLLHRPQSPPSSCSPELGPHKTTPCSLDRPDLPESETNSPTGNHLPPPYSPDHTHTPTEMSLDEESPDPITAFMKKFTDTLEDLGANKHINVPQF